MLLEKIIDAIFEQVVQTGTELTFNKFIETERGRKLLKKFNVSRSIQPNDFDSIYKLAIIEYSVNNYRNDDSKIIIRVFADKGLQRAFENSIKTSIPTDIQQCLDELYEASSETGELGAVARNILEQELEQLKQIFQRIVEGLRPLYFDLFENKQESNHKTIVDILEGIKSQLSTNQGMPSISSAPEPFDNLTVSNPKIEYLQNLTKVEMAIAANPSDTKAWLRKASILYNEGDDMDGALKAINEALKLDADSVDILHAKACILCDYAASRGNSPKSFLAEALELFEQVRTEVGEAITDYHMGNVLSGMDRHEEAITKFQTAIRTLNDNELQARAWTNMGNSFNALSQHPQAIEAFQNAIKLDPKKWQAFLSWGDMVLRISNPDFNEAASLYWNAMEINPSLKQASIRANYNLAYCLWRLEHYSDVIEYSNNVLAINPEHRDAKLLKGYALLELCEEEELYMYHTIKFFKDWNLDEPSNTFVSHTLQWIYESNGYKDHARLVIEKTVNPESVPPFVAYDYALFLKAEGDLDGAIKWMNIAVRQSHEHQYVHQYAHLQFNKGDYRTALQYYRLATIDCTESDNVLKSIANCYYFLGEFKNCVAMMMKLILLEPQEKDWWSSLSYSLIKVNLTSLLPQRNFLQQLHAGTAKKMECIKLRDNMLAELGNVYGSSFIEMIKSNKLPD